MILLIIWNMCLTIIVGALVYRISGLKIKYLKHPILEIRKDGIWIGWGNKGFSRLRRIITYKSFK